MFSELRRKDKELSLEKAEEILATEIFGVLSTIGVDGYPYGVPLNYVFLDGKIYFHCASGVGAKVENIKNNPKACFTVVGDTEVLPGKFSTRFESVVVLGEVSETLGQYKKDVLFAFLDKFSKGFEQKGEQYLNAAIDKTSVFELMVSNIVGKGQRDSS